MSAANSFQCHPRRHMTASEFVTYDTIVAMAKKNKASTPVDLVFYGRMTTVANKTNRCINVERANVQSLIRKGWLIQYDRTRWRGGQWGTNRYDVVEHEWYLAHAQEYADAPSPCPPCRYDPQTGEKILKCTAPRPDLAERMKRKRQHSDTLTVVEQS